MELRGRLTDLVVQQTVNERMHILVTRGRLLPGIEPRRDGVQARLDLVAFVERQHVRFVQRHRPRLRQLNVEWPQPKIDTDRAVERIERGRGAVGKATAPQLVRFGGRRADRHRRHAIWSAGSTGASSTTEGA